MLTVYALWWERKAPERELEQISPCAAELVHSTRSAASWLGESFTGEKLTLPEVLKQDSTYRANDEPVLQTPLAPRMGMLQINFSEFFILSARFLKLLQASYYHLFYP